MFFVLLSAISAMFCASPQMQYSNMDAALLYTSGNGFSLFFNPPTGAFYLLQTTEKLSVPASVTFQSFSKESGLTIKDSRSAHTINYSIGGQVLGMATFSGSRYASQLTTTAPNGTVAFVGNVGDVIFELSCHCRRNGTAQPEGGCQSGGDGSTGCEITDGGGFATGNWNNHCQVSCASGYYACCNE